MRLGTALVISAPSGAGKTTLVKKLLKEFSATFEYSVSCTTRTPRLNEEDGKDYHFMSLNDFKAARSSGYFAEWAQVHGNLYGTPLKQLQDIFASGRDVLLDVDVQGAAQLKNTLPHAMFVFILPPSMHELECRLRARNSDDPEAVRIRLENACAEIACARWFDAVVINEDLERAYSTLRAIYIAATCKTGLHHMFVDKLLQ